MRIAAQHDITPAPVTGEMIVRLRVFDLDAMASDPGVAAWLGPRRAIPLLEAYTYPGREGFDGPHFGSQYSAHWTREDIETRRQLRGLAWAIDEHGNRLSVAWGNYIQLLVDAGVEFINNLDEEVQRGGA